MRFRRAELVERFQDMARRGQPIVGGGAGTGLSAKCEEAGGIDLIVIYNSGRYRMAGRGSLAGLLAYGNANEIVVEMELAGVRPEDVDIEIENGALTYPVSEVTIASNLKDMFLRMVPASDLDRNYGTASPTLFIEGMTLAGS
jgi:hypothetical protein